MIPTKDGSKIGAESRFAVRLPISQKNKKR
jgi:hypothetical protein